jgi:hypothetical protein
MCVLEEGELGQGGGVWWEDDSAEEDVGVAVDVFSQGVQDDVCSRNGGTITELYRKEW